MPAYYKYVQDRMGISKARLCVFVISQLISKIVALKNLSDFLKDVFCDITKAKKIGGNCFLRSKFIIFSDITIVGVTVRSDSARQFEF